MARDLYGKFAEVYDSVMRSQFFYDLYYAFAVEMCRKHKVKPKAVLELACGTGNLMQIFKANEFSVEGLDISEGMLLAAKSKGLKVALGDISNFNLGRKYDLILCIFDSLNHLSTLAKLESCFKSVKRHLCGLFIFDLNSDYRINEIMPLYGVQEKMNYDGYEIAWKNFSRKNRWTAQISMVDEKFFH